MVKVVGEEPAYRKATLTDANGKFTLRGLSGGPAKLTARNLEMKQNVQLPLVIDDDKSDVEVRLQPMSLSADLKKYTVLGMQLTDVTPELRSAYDLYETRGALVLDAGKDFQRMITQPISEGCVFWVVGKARVGSVAEFVNQLLAETANQNAEVYSLRVAYSFTRLDLDGTSTVYLKLTNDDVKQLRILADKITPR
jgi:hypothetical protein